MDIPQQSNQSTQSTLIKPKSAEKQGPKMIWWPWLIVVVALAVIFYVFTKVCNCGTTMLMLILLLNYLLLLIMNYLSKFKIKSNWLFVLLLALMPVITAVSTAGWAWWLWLIVVVAYLIVMSAYFISMLSENYWSTIIPLTLFLILMLIII